MLIIWRGFGIMVPVIVVGMAVLADFVVLAVFGNTFWRANFALVNSMHLAISAGLLWFLGSNLNSRPGQVLVDTQTGQTIELRRRHDFFFIPMQWWAIPVVLGIVYYVGRGLTIW